MLNILFLYQKIINICKTNKDKSKENQGQQRFIDLCFWQLSPTLSVAFTQ